MKIRFTPISIAHCLPVLVLVLSLTPPAAAQETMAEAMDCLGQMLWESQRAGRPPDGDAYIACVQRRATRD